VDGLHWSLEARIESPVSAFVSGVRRRGLIHADNGRRRYLVRIAPGVEPRLHRPTYRQRGSGRTTGPFDQAPKHRENGDQRERDDDHGEAGHRTALESREMRRDYSAAATRATRPATGRSAILKPMVRQLSRKIPLAELHCHLGGAVTPAIMWSIAHAQGIKLPTRDYWEFRDTITVSDKRNRSFDGYLQLFHWTELIQSSPIAVERAVYEVVGGAYRKNNVTTMELRFNPMKRNRGGEQDLDHIIAAASRGMDRASLEYPVKPGLIFCLDRAFPFELNEIITEKAIAWRDRGIVGIDIAGPESSTFRVADYRRLFRRARQFGLGLTVHTGESGSVDEVARVVEMLEPDRIGHGVKAAYDPRAMAMIRDRGIVLEICPTSNLNTRVVSGWDEFRWIFDTFRRNEIRFTINTDGPEMLKTYIRDEMATLGRLGILSVDDQELAAATSLASSFVPNVSDVPATRIAPATRDVVEREEA
jgi:adenosine deaminase